MNKKIKMIELLNKINNQEELPRKIQYGYDNDNCPAIWRLNTSLKDYCCDERDSGDNYLFRDYIGDITVVLDNEVEILEDNTEEIEELEEFDIQGLEISGYSMTQAEYLLEDGINENREKINEIIRYIKRKDKNND